MGATGILLAGCSLVSRAGAPQGPTSPTYQQRTAKMKKNKNYLRFYVDGHAEQRSLQTFLACPNKNNQAPWYVEWEEGELKAGAIPYPSRH